MMKPQFGIPDIPRTRKDKVVLPTSANMDFIEIRSLLAAKARYTTASEHPETRQISTIHKKKGLYVC